MGSRKPPAGREGEAHSHRGEAVAALSRHYLPHCNMGECRLLVRVVDQLHFSYGAGARMMTSKFLRTGVLPNGERKMADIGLSERNFREALYGINGKWPGLIARWQEPDQFGSPVYWWNLNLDMFLACPMPAGGAVTETQNMAIKPVARDLPPRTEATYPPGRQHPTPPVASDLPPRSPATPLNTNYKSELEIRTEIRPDAGASGGEIGGFKVGFSLSDAEGLTPENSTPTTPAKFDAAERIKAVAGQAVEKAATRRTERAQRAKLKPGASRKANDLKAIWVAAVADSCPNFPAPHLAPAEIAQLKRLVNDWNDANGDLSDMMAFAAREWSGIMATQFAWHTKKPVPVTPDLGFFSMHWRHFAKAFAAGRHYQLADDKRNELQKLMAGGMSEANAMQVLREREAPKVRKRQPPTQDGAMWTKPGWTGPKRAAGQ